MNKVPSGNISARKRLKRRMLIRPIVFAVFVFMAVLASAICVFFAVCRESAVWQEDETAETEQREPDILTEYRPEEPYGDGFLADMREYEEYINPLKDKRDGFAVLVNNDHRLKSGNIPDDLTDLPDGFSIGGKETKLSLYAEKALEAMFIELEAQNIPLIDENKQKIVVYSGYVSYSECEETFYHELQKVTKMYPSLSASAAEELASVSVPRPGTDEHQTGLCVDFSSGTKAPGISFGSTELYKWLTDNSWKFGYILRYPENKVDVTGVVYQPWHFRYVGRYHAEQMKKLGMCLEEYSEYLKS